MTEEEMLAEENLPKGILCAVVACIVGAVAWGLIFPIPYLAQNCHILLQKWEVLRYVYKRVLFRSQNHVTRNSCNTFLFLLM